MAHTHFQYLAYQTPTFGFAADGTVLSALPSGDTCDAIADIPVPTNLGLSDDAFNRLRRLAAVVDRAANNLVGDQASTLKIFMAPEFYFRPESGVNAHSYDSAERGKILASLGTMFKNVRFDNWLIVAGTIIANTPILPRPAAAPFHYFYNTAIVIRGGSYYSKLYSIEKQQPSNIDGVPITGGIASPFYAAGNYSAHYGAWDQRKKRLFSEAGVNFGLDICLDHAGPTAFDNAAPPPAYNVQDLFRMAKRTAAESLVRPPLPAPLPNIALHLLTAGGMPIQAQSVVANANGYILRTDGSPGLGPYVELKRITNYTTPAGATTPYDLGPGAPNPVPAPGGSSNTFPQCPVANMVNIMNIGNTPLTGKLKIPFPNQYNPNNMDQLIATYPVTAMP